MRGGGYWWWLGASPAMKLAAGLHVWGNEAKQLLGNRNAACSLADSCNAESCACRVTVIEAKELLGSALCSVILLT